MRTQDLLCRPCGGVLPDAARTEKQFREAAGATPPSPHGLPHPLARAWSHSFSHVASLLQGSLLWHARLVTNHAALLSFILTSSGF